MPRNDDELQDQNNNQGPTLNIQLNTKQQSTMTMVPPSASFAPGSPQLKLAEKVMDLWKDFSKQRNLKNNPTNSAINMQIDQNGDMSNPTKGNNPSQLAGQFMNMVLQNNQKNGFLNPNNALNLQSQIGAPRPSTTPNPLNTKLSPPKPGG